MRKGYNGSKTKLSGKLVVDLHIRLTRKYFRRAGIDSETRSPIELELPKSTQARIRRLFFILLGGNKYEQTFTK